MDFVCHDTTKMSPRALIFGKRAAIIYENGTLLEIGSGRAKHGVVWLLLDQINGERISHNFETSQYFSERKMPPEVTLDSFFLQYYDSDL